MATPKSPPLLNPEQARAVDHLDGPLLVLAGAGSGKTRVITFRIARLIERGVRAKNILAVTFTNKAAREMRERVSELLGDVIARDTHLSTFHALGAAILREDIEKLGYNKRFTIVDQADRTRIMRQILKELNLSGTSVSEDQLLGVIGRAKNSFTTPSRLPGARFNPAMPRAQRVFDLYGDALRNLNAVDFDDLLLLPTMLLRDRGDLRAKYRERYRYVMVDEYQDTNAIQMAFLAELVGPPHNLVVVGDDDQSIYGFRGAVADNILGFDKTFKGAETISLEQNYRSKATILNAANAVIAHNAKRHAKKLWSDLGEGSKIREFVFASEVEEAHYIAGRIGAQASAEQRKFGDFAILYRANKQTRPLEEALRAYRVPYRIIGGQSVFDKKEVKDTLAYLRLLLNTRDELAARRILNVPTRGIGTTSAAAIDAFSKSEGISFWAAVTRHEELELVSKARAGAHALVEAVETARARLREATRDELGEVIDGLLDAIGLESAIRAGENNPKVAQLRWRLVQELRDNAARVDGATAQAALERYVQRLSLDQHNVGNEEGDVSQMVTLLTMHSSKGLEFPIVYIVGMVEGILPHQNAIDENNIPEERRLCYVGMTRAKHELNLSRARHTRKRNERVALKPSRFLAEIPPDLLQLSKTTVVQPIDDAQRLVNESRLAELKEMLKKKT